MMIKTHLSLSHETALKGVPKEWLLPVRDILIYSGAKFFCPCAGTILLMPGTSCVPAFRRIGINVKTRKEQGVILMKKIIVLIIIGIGIFILYQKISNKSHEIELLYDKPYIVVYGKDSCGSTQKCLKDLENTDFKYQYKNLDNKAVGDELHPRMRKAGLDTKYYLIPVVDINGKILIRPTIEEISSIYNSN